MTEQERTLTLADPNAMQPTPLLPTTRWGELAWRDELRQDTGVADILEAEPTPVPDFGV